MFNKLIKYLEENFNSEITYKIEFKAFLKSDLHLVDLPTVVKAFEGNLKIDGDGDGTTIVYRDGSLCLLITYSSSEDNSKKSKIDKSEIIIFSN